MDKNLNRRKNDSFKFTLGATPNLMMLSPTKPSPPKTPAVSASPLPSATKYVFAKMADGRTVRLTQEQYKQIVGPKKVMILAE